MTGRKYAPAEIRLAQVFAVDGSVRGIRETIVQHKRVSCTTDELCNISTPWSEAGTSHAYLSRSKLCTFSQGERNDVLTAKGALHLRSYAFQIKACGQLEPVEPRITAFARLPSGPHSFALVLR